MPFRGYGVLRDRTRRNANPGSAVATEPHETGQRIIRFGGSTAFWAIEEHACDLQARAFLGIDSKRIAVDRVAKALRRAPDTRNRKGAAEESPR